MADWKNTKCRNCVIQRRKPICNSCIGHHYYRPMTNAQKIRSMTDEELAEFLGNEKIRDEHSLCSDFGNGCYYSCKKNHACHDNIEQLYIKWLQSKAE